MALPYDDTAEDVVATYRRVHGNGEQTHVAVLSAGREHYAAVAYDLDPVTFTPVAAEAVAYDPTLDGCVERAQRWMDQHPKGVADDGDGGGWMDKLWAVLKRLDEYGNEQLDEAQRKGGQP